MKDRALRRHQDLRAKKKSEKAYNSCIGDLSQSEKADLEGNVDKLRKICVASHTPHDPKKVLRKPIRELKHDITMKEELTL